MRWLVGLLLIAAAVLKAVELYEHPTSVLGHSYSWFLTPLLIGGELGLGLFAILGLHWRQLRLAAMILFAGFACYSLLLALQGAASCGCFGQVEISPWWTFLLDSVVLSGLTLEHLTERQGKHISDTPTKLPPKGCVSGTVMISMAVVIGLASHVTPRQSSSQDGFQAVGDLVILEPETWINQPFPLIDYINVDVSQGKWVLLMHRHHCPECQEAVPKYEHLSSQQVDGQVALIEVPPFDTTHETRTSLCRIGRLTEELEWFIETPVEIQLVDGVVMNASTELSSLSELALGNYSTRVAFGSTVDSSHLSQTNEESIP